MKISAVSITQEYVQSLLDYDPVTGFLTWKVSRSNISIGDRAGCLKPNGYLKVGIDGTHYLAHRLIWLHVYGTWPDKEVDHKNRVRSENSIKNLRLATTGQNRQNQRRRTNNTSGFTGVYLDKRHQRWVARVGLNGKMISAGSYPEIHQAASAYKRLKSQLHSFNPSTP